MGAKRGSNLAREKMLQVPNELWSGATSMVRIDDGLMYLCIVIDIFSRYLFAYRLSNTGDADLSCATQQGTISHYGAPHVFHSDKGSTYTSCKYQALLRRNHITASMTGSDR